MDRKYIENTKQYYNDRLGKENESSLLNMEDWFRWEEIELRIKEYLKQTNADKLSVLDYGCGTGWLSNQLSKYAEVTGIDISDKAILLASKKYPQVSFIAFDASSKEVEKLGNKKFDIIVSSEVIEHIENQSGYFDNMMSFLKAKGLLVLTTPNGKWKDNYFFGNRKNWGQPFEFWLSSDQLNTTAKSHLNKISISSFHSQGLLYMKSYGLFNFLGNRFILKGLKILYLNKLYYKILDKLGLGLYLILTGIKNEN